MICNTYILIRKCDWIKKNCCNFFQCQIYLSSQVIVSNRVILLQRQSFYSFFSKFIKYFCQKSSKKLTRALLSSTCLEPNFSRHFQNPIYHSVPTFFCVKKNPQNCFLFVCLYLGMPGRNAKLHPSLYTLEYPQYASWYCTHFKSH